MKKIERYDFQGSPPHQFIVVPLQVVHAKMPDVARIYAIVDTGFDDTLLLGDVFATMLRDTLGIPPDELEPRTLWAMHAFGVSCEIYYLHVRLPGMGDKWAKIRAYVPLGIPHLGNWIGMQLLKLTRLCIRGPERETVAVTE